MLKIEVGSSGVQGAESALGMLNNLGAAKVSAVLYSKPRLDGSAAENGDIAEWLAENGRDFFSLGDDEGEVVKEVLEEIVRQVDVAINTDSAPMDKGMAINIKAGAFLKGLRKHAKTIIKRLETQTTADKSNPSPIDPEYARQRNTKYGVAEDVVGIASRDLLDNFASGSFEIKVG